MKFKCFQYAEFDNVIPMREFLLTILALLSGMATNKLAISVSDKVTFFIVLCFNFLKQVSE